MRTVELVIITHIHMISASDSEKSYNRVIIIVLITSKDACSVETWKTQ